VTEVAITQNQIQSKLIPNGSETGKTRMFKTVRVDPEISKLLEQYEKALEILRGKKGVLQKGAQLLMDKEKIEGDELKALMGETSPGTDEP
jgi:ATP-dependent Zn protease